MFGILTTEGKRKILAGVIDDLHGKMTERGSLSTGAEKLGKQILHVLRNEVKNGTPTTDGNKIALTFPLSKAEQTDAVKTLQTMLADSNSTKSITDLNAAFDGKIIIEKKDNDTTFTVKGKKK